MKSSITRTYKVIGMASALLLCGASGVFAAGVDFGMRAGYHFNADKASIGAELLTRLEPRSSDWYLNPNIEWNSGRFEDTASLNMDFHHDFETASNTAVWAGAGPALYIIDRGQFGNDDVEPAMNVLFGFGAKRGDVRPFVQAKGVFMDESEAVLSVGVRF